MLNYKLLTKDMKRSVKQSVGENLIYRDIDWQIGKIPWGIMALEQVTSKGTGLNPNVKVCQEITSGNPGGTPVTEISWNETAATSGSHPEGNTELSEDMCKEYEVTYSPSCETTRNTADIEESADGMLLGPEDLNYQLYDVSGNFCCFVAQWELSIISSPSIQ